MGGRPSKDAGAGGATGFPGRAGAPGGGTPAGGAGGAGGLIFSGDCARVPLAHWTLDDCSPSQTALGDTAFSSIAHPGFRLVSTACDVGIGNQGLRFATSDDLFYAPDQPDFLFEQGLTIGLWIKPDKLGGVQNLARKRFDGSSSFVLALEGNNLVFAVQLRGGRTGGVSVPFTTVGAWTHVAATYDGKKAILYVNGAAVAETNLVGVLAPGVGPFFIGNDASGRRLKGEVDDIWLNNLAAPADVIRSLTCVHGKLTASLTPAVSPPTAAGDTFTFDLALSSGSSETCDADTVIVSPSFPAGLTSNLGRSVSLPPTQTVHVPVAVTGDVDLDPGLQSFTLFVFSQSKRDTTTVSGALAVAPPTGCTVNRNRELFIRDVSVVDDPIRTSLAGDAADPRTGAWTFGRLMERLAPRPEDAPDLVEALLSSFETPQVINGFKVAPRPFITPTIHQAWPRRPDGKLDLARAPLLLNAIVNRIDLRDLSVGNAGEGRFVFGFMGPGAFPLQATLIMEFTLPASSQADIQAWADAWHGLATHPFPSEEYNAALQAITDRITARGAVPTAPNGSGLLRLRTNEIDFGDNKRWELREFNFDAETGFLVPATVKVTPDLSFNGGPVLSSFMTANATDILADRHVVPETFADAPFLGGAIFNDLQPWFSDGSVDNEVRHHLSLNTCNGCHGGETGAQFGTNTAFLQVFPRLPGQEAGLSSFLTGETTPDPLTGAPRTFNDLARRREDLKLFVCPQTTSPTPPTDGDGASAAPAPTLTKGISRTE